MTPSPPDPGRAPREQRITEAFVTLADSLVEDFDLPDLLHRLAMHCVDLLGADGAGVMLTDPNGRIRLLASSSESMRLLELFEIDADQGPCLAACRSGTTVEEPDLAAPDNRWTEFAVRAHADGYGSVHAIPMRLRSQVIGVLNLFSTAPGRLHPPDRQLGRALADVATIALLQERAVSAHRTLADQLQSAFTTRLHIEQAKGTLAERLGIDADEAFQRMRRHARQTRRKLVDLAQDVTTGKITLPDDPATSRRRSPRQRDG
jgi:GAF domain-containing protein